MAAFCIVARACRPKRRAVVEPPEGDDDAAAQMRDQRQPVDRERILAERDASRRGIGIAGMNGPSSSSVPCARIRLMPQVTTSAPSSRP